MPGAMRNAIETSSLTKFYGTFRAVDALDLAIAPGEIYGLLGPNGAGKTTVIKMLCQLLKPSVGRITLLDRELPHDGVQSDIGYMPQETAVYQGLTIHQNLKFYGEIFGLCAKK